MLHRHATFRILALRDIDERPMDDRFASLLSQAHVSKRVNTRAILVAKTDLVTEEPAVLSQLGKEPIAVSRGVV
jgi:hypothetical protein